MRNLKSRTKLFYTFFLDFFFPVKCVNCGKYGEIICFDCAKEISVIRTSTCPECGRISANGQFCRACKGRHRDLALKGIVVATHYEGGPIKELIHCLKYSGYISLAEHLGELICGRVSNLRDLKNFVVVPVPLHISRKNRRGFNQSELIARHVSAKLDLPGGDALARNQNTRPQAELPRAKRLINLEGAFSCQDAEFVEGKKVLLIDDVATTGATLNECAKALKNAGAKEVWGAVVAKNI